MSDAWNVVVTAVAVSQGQCCEGQRRPRCPATVPLSRDTPPLFTRLFTLVILITYRGTIHSI